jgi:mono/diheme cytochrome c family protein
MKSQKIVFMFLFSLGLFYYAGVKKSAGSEAKNLSVPHVNNQSTLAKSIASGKELYADFCVTCHLSNGKGDGANFPPLAGSNWLNDKRSQTIYAVKFGQSGPIIVNGKKYNNSMPDMSLTDQEVADVLNYVMNTWGNKQSKMITSIEVSKIKK